MDERFCDLHNGITLCYETFGDRSDPTALLIMGLGTQMVAWHEDFCRELAAAGFHVVRFDNRDIGRSTHLPGDIDAGQTATGWLLVHVDPSSVRRAGSVRLRFPDVALEGYAAVEDAFVEVRLAGAGA